MVPLPRSSPRKLHSAFQIRPQQSRYTQPQIAATKTRDANETATARLPRSLTPTLARIQHCDNGDVQPQCEAEMRIHSTTSKLGQFRSGASFDSFRWRISQNVTISTISLEYELSRLTRPRNQRGKQPVGGIHTTKIDSGIQSG